MPAPAPFVLSPKLLARHGFAGRVLALPPSALGGLVQLAEALPPPAGEPWALQGRRADCQVWAPVQPPRPKADRLDPEDGDGPDSDDEDPDEESSSGGYALGGVVRVVSVRGILASEVTAWECGVMDGYQGAGGVVSRWRAAHADPDAVAVVLDAMAPGGDALMCMESAAEMAAITAASGKPAAVFASEATSAMYALACGAASSGLFFAAPSADVGNVGTRTWHVDRSAKNADDGIKVTHIGSPPGKILGNPDEPLAPEALARITRDVEESTARFAAFVAERRGASVDAVLSFDADTGRGQRAVDAKLVDAIVPNLAAAVAAAYGAAMAKLTPPITSSTLAPFEDDDMKLTPATLEALGMSGIAATPAAVEAHVKRLATQLKDAEQREALAASSPEADPLRALGAVVLAKLGHEDPIAAMVEAPRRLEAGAGAPAVADQNAALRREKAWDDAIAAGSFFAFEVWGTGGKQANAGRYTQMAAAINAAHADVGQLEARLAKFPKVKTANGTTERADADMAQAADAQRAALALPDKWVRIAAKAKVDPARLAARAAENMSTPQES